MSEQRPLHQPRQTDAEAANSATPDTDRLPAWDDQDYHSYLYAVDINYRLDWDRAHGASREDLEATLDEWYEWHDEDDEDDEDE